jgi:SNF2 family DNA or RNA helicase
LPAEVNAARRLPAELRTALLGVAQGPPTPCATCGDVPEDPVISKCGHLYCRQCAASGTGAAGHGSAEAELAFHCLVCGHALAAGDVFGAAALEQAAGSGPPEVKPIARTKDKHASDSNWQSSSKIEALMELLRELKGQKPAGRSLNEDSGGGGANTGSEDSDEEDFKPKVRNLSAAKLSEALGRGRQARVSPPARSPARDVVAEKAIVFSQWTSMLDLVEVPLRNEG